MHQKPKLSVCLTHYNRPEKLAATLESLANQTRMPDEVLVWDDCSPKDPTSVALQFSHRFPSFRYQRNPVNLGMPGNLNAVIREATGDLIANLHDADIFHPTLLEKWEKRILQDDAIGLVFCGLEEQSGKLWIQDMPDVMKGHDFFEKFYVGTNSSVIWGTVMTRKTVYDKLWPFDPQFKNWADVDMWMRICADHKIGYVAEPLIKLDCTPTPVRAFGWAKTRIIHLMHYVNIKRIAQNPDQLKRWLAIQRKVSSRKILRNLVGRLKRLEFSKIPEGVKLYFEDAANSKNN
jgi:glycosyltransferase involved in cell wall biosynthesis